MNGVDDHHVLGEIETEPLGAFAEIEMSDRPEVIGLETRCEGRFGVLPQRHLACPTDVIEFVVLEVALVRAAVDDQEYPGQQNEQSRSRAFGHAEDYCRGVGRACPMKTRRRTAGWPDGNPACGLKARPHQTHQTSLCCVGR